jgi:methyl-accepting chemotaxis protein
MDQTISEVVDGSALAEQAASQMQSSLDATNELVQSVEKIATDSAEQVQISQDLQTRAERIVEATQSTGKELLSLTSLTSSMAEAGKRLVQSVNVFKLEA